MPESSEITCKMLFNSASFLIFLPVVFVLYWFVCGRNVRSQNLLLLASSYVFYGWWDWRFLFLLIFSTGLDYFTGLKIQDAQDPRWKRIWLWISVSANLGFLGFFKYFNFFVDSAIRLLETLGMQANPWSLKILLPVGISFYTFHGLSYVIDIYYGRITPTRNRTDYSLFVSYFPLLVAGPIERATHLLPQLEKPRTFDDKLAIDGLRLALWGFFKKLVIADTMAVEVDRIFGGYEQYGGGNLILGAVYFAIQVYGDFSGYTDIARGISRLFGIELLLNFKFPYLSRSIPEFWGRWHISLSSWLNDYVFTPVALQLRDRGRNGMFIAVMTTFLVSGLWHGAAWHFVAWGGLHGLLYLPYIYRKSGLKGLVPRKEVPLRLRDIPSILLTFMLVCVGYILFRAQDMEVAVKYLGGILSSPLSFDAYFLKSSFNIFIPLTFIIDLVHRKGYLTGRYSTWFLVTEFSILTALILALGNFGSVEFIYFQF
jgi:D-alanyl-lipoteichoic acid acyltransferase DltB (MBOAT superfamily)